MKLNFYKSVIQKLEKKIAKYKDYGTLTPSTVNELEAEFEKELRKYIQSTLASTSSVITSRMSRRYKGYKSSGWKARHSNLKGWRNRSDVTDEMRKELRARIKFSMSLIKTQSAKNTELLKSRFLGFLQRNNREGLRDALKASKEFGKANRHQKFILRDQTTKMLGNFDKIIADKYRAAGFVWETMQDSRVSGADLDPASKEAIKLDKSKTHGNHASRDGKIYIYPDSWILKNHLVRKDKITIADATNLPDGLPGQPIGCRCWARNLYDLNDIVDELGSEVLTKIGEDYLYKR